MTSPSSSDLTLWDTPLSDWSEGEVLCRLSDILKKRNLQKVPRKNSHCHSDRETELLSKNIFIYLQKKATIHCLFFSPTLPKMYIINITWTVCVFFFPDCLSNCQDTIKQSIFRLPFIFHCTKIGMTIVTIPDGGLRGKCWFTK